MRKLSKTIMALMLVVSMMISTAIVSYAAPAPDDESNLANGMDRYIGKNVDGTLYLDSNSAVNAGYSENSIIIVQNQINYMNTLVLQKVTSIDSTYSATIYLPSPRYRGISKVVAHWWGTEVYMNSTQAQQLINNLSRIGDVTTMTGLIGLLPGGIASVVGGISGLVGAGTLVSRWQVEQAAKAGRGIVMVIQPNYAVPGQTITTFRQQ